MIPENKSVTDQVKDFVFGLFKNKLGGHYVYHNLKHTEEVTDAVKRISGKMNLSDEDTEIVTLAAILHDTGFTVRSANHEDASIEIAVNFLKEINYPEDKIEKIKGCINATRLPQTPNNVLEEIIADADLYHLGTKDYQLKSDLLRTEWELEKNNQFTDLEWLKINIDFLSSHKYFTKYAKKYLDESKSETLIKLQKSYRKKSEKLIKSENQNESLPNPAQQISDIKENANESGNNFESIRHNIFISGKKQISLADRKAHVMLGLSIFVFTALVVSDFYNISNIPAMIILAACFLCMIFTVSVLFPKNTYSGISNRENLSDTKFINDALRKEYMNLDYELANKNKFLRICYLIFVAGIVLSIVSYLVISKISLDKL